MLYTKATLINENDDEGWLANGFFFKRVGLKESPTQLKHFVDEIEVADKVPATLISDLSKPTDFIVGHQAYVFLTEACETVLVQKQYVNEIGLTEKSGPNGWDFYYVPDKWVLALYQRGELQGAVMRLAKPGEEYAS